MKRLKRALEEKGVTRKACAARLGMTEKTLYNKMSGRSEFTFSQVQRLRALLPEYGVDGLLADEQEETGEG